MMTEAQNGAHTAPHSKNRMEADRANDPGLAQTTGTPNKARCCACFGGEDSDARAAAARTQAHKHNTSTATTHPREDQYWTTKQPQDEQAVQQESYPAAPSSCNEVSFELDMHGQEGRSIDYVPQESQHGDDLPPTPVRPASTDLGALVMHAIPEYTRSSQIHQQPEQLVTMTTPRPTTPPPPASSLPFSPTPSATPRGTPAGKDVQATLDAHNDMLRVQASDGAWVSAQTVEMIIQQTVKAVKHCMLVTHWTSPDVACLLTLRSAAGSPGQALDRAGLDLANRSGSEAATIMSARSCATFRRGLALALEQTNSKLKTVGVQIRRFQILREDLTATNGMLMGDGSLNRPAILIRYRHLVDDMFQYEARYPHKWMEGDEKENANIYSNRSQMDSADSVDSRHSRAHANNTNEYARSLRGQVPALGLNGLQSEAGSFGERSSIQGYEQINPSNDSVGNTTPRMGSSREPSRYGGSREPSPRGMSPRTMMSQRRGNQQRLPQSLRLLDMQEVTGASGNKAHTRGRYFNICFRDPSFPIILRNPSSPWYPLSCMFVVPCTDAPCPFVLLKIKRTILGTRQHLLPCRPVCFHLTRARR